MFSHLSVPKVNLFFFSAPLCRPIPSHQLPPLSLSLSLFLFPVVTSCIHEFRGLPFLRLPGGDHYNILLGSLSWSILS